MKEDEELYLFVRSNPLALNILGLVSESARGLTVSEISMKLNKMLPSVSRSISRLVERDLVESVTVGRNKFFKVKPGKQGFIRRLVDHSAGFARNPPLFRILAVEESVSSVIVRELERHMVGKFDVLTKAGVSGRFLDHSFDILLRDSRTIGIEIIQGSNVDTLFERIGRWSDLRDTDLESIIVIVLGAMRQPFRSFFESLRDNQRPRIEAIFLDLPLTEMDERVVRQRIVEPILRSLSSAHKRR